MSGIIILFVLGVWGVISYFCVKLALWRVKDSNIKIFTSILLISLMFIAPIADEIIGGFQFRELCRDHTIFILNETTARGKSVAYQNIAQKKYDNYLVPIVESQELYKDIVSNEIVVYWNVFRAEGGILSRSLNLFESTKPYTFNGVCISPVWRKTIFSDLNITVN